jgi:uncharacterized protein
MKKIVTLLFVLFYCSAFSQKAIPELWGLHVHDDAHILSQQTIDNLETRLKAFEDSTSNQLAILIIPSLNGEVLEDYSLRVSEKWKLGQKDKDNGALLLIAVDDHKMRIETGEGLEGVLPDAICNRIIRNEIAPDFRKGNYDDGITRGIDAVIRAIGGEYKASTNDNSGSSIEATDLGLKGRLLIGLFIFGILGIFTFIGLFSPGFSGWFLYVFLLPFYATFPMIVFGVQGGIIAVIIYAIVFPIARIFLRRTTWGTKMQKKMKNNRGKKGGGWSSGGGWFGGGGSGWSSGGGGGFSGGGGSFGGGGSSGSW